MTTTSSPSSYPSSPPHAPPTSEVEPPRDINDFNAHSDYYRSDAWGVDCIPVATSEKNHRDEDRKIRWFADWLEFKEKPMPPEIIEEHKSHPLHSYNQLKGIGVIAGIVKYGPNKGRWIIFFDADNDKGKEAVLKILDYDSIDNLLRDCVCEHHPSAPDKIHVFALAEVPLDNFAGLTTDREKVKKNLIPGFEIKGRGSGLAYVTPSLYDGPIKGERYQLVEGSVLAPARLFTEHEVSQWENRLEEICQLHGTSSLVSNGKVPISDLLSPGFVVTKGNNRKNHVLRVAMHYLKEDEKTAEEKTKLWNEECCNPPLAYDVYKEFPDAWAWGNKYHRRHKEEQEEEERGKVGKTTSKESKREQNINTATRIVEDQYILWFHDEYQTGYMRVKVDNHFEIYRVSRKDRKFKLFITKMYYDVTGGATLKDDELTEVLRALEAKATFSKTCKNIHLRKSWAIKSVDQRTFKEDLDKRIIFYDMCDPDWRCIMIDGENGTWHMLPTHPENMPFFRYQQKPQVIPKKPGQYSSDILDKWAEKMHIYDPKGKLIFKVWVIGFFIPDVPHPILIPVGMQGAAKSTLCKQLQQITDPYAGDPLILPDSKREAAQQAHHRAILIYDNIEYEIPKWLSDFLSQLVTGATISKRELYSDDNDIIYHIMRSVILNGLVTPKLKPDAKDRTIELPMERISDDKRKEQAEIDQWFQDNLEDIMGAIYDTLAKSLQIFPDVKLSKLPRMADFMRRGVAISRSLAIVENNERRTSDVLEQEFVEAYSDIMKRQNFDVIESSSVSDAFVRWCTEVLAAGKEMKSAEYLQKGTVKYQTGELLSILTLKGSGLGFDVKDKEWPKKPQVFRNELKGAAADIRNAHRIDIKIARDDKNYSQVTITNLDFKPEDKGSSGVGGDTPAGVGSNGAKEETRTDFSSNLGGFSEISSRSSEAPEAPKSSSKIEKISGASLEAPDEAPDEAPENKGQIRAQNEGFWSSGASGAFSNKPSLFSAEDSSVPKTSLIDDIKHSAIALDSEWDNKPGMDSRLLQFNFYDSQGKNWVVNVNRDCDGFESVLLDKVEDTIRNYKVVLTYYEKGVGMGFSKWDDRCRALGKPSPIFMGYRNDQKDACINIVNKDGVPIKDIDLGLVYEMPIIENFLHNIYLSNELDEVAKALLGEGKLEGMSGEQFADLPLEKQVAYGMKDAELTYRLAGARNYAVLAMLEKVGQIFIGGKFADLSKMCVTGPTKWWATLFQNKFNASPSPTAIKGKGEEGELKGGHVEDISQIRQYRWVTIFDFTGQYPSIISKYNICFSTACCLCCSEDSLAKVRTGLPEVDDNGWWFCRKQRGILPQIVDALVVMRRDFKAKMKAAEGAEQIELAQQYDIMQNACKLLANSLYGVFGQPFFDFGDLRLANTITGFGRAKVIDMGSLINQIYPYLKSVYHDTDSAFIVGFEPKDGEILDENHPIIKDIIDKVSAPEKDGGLGLPLEFKKCYKKVIIKASKNYMGIDAATGKIETVGLVGKKRNQCKLVRNTFEQQREYWKDDAPKEVIEGHINDILYRFDHGLIPLEELQEKMTIGEDPWTGYKNANVPTCFFGRKYNKRQGESTPPFYLAQQKKKDNDLWFTEDPNKINYKKYKERLRTALMGLLVVRGYNIEQIDDLLGFAKPPKKKRKVNMSRYLIGESPGVINLQSKSKEGKEEKEQQQPTTIKVENVWAMHDRRTFEIPEVAKLIQEECVGIPEDEIVDLFPFDVKIGAKELLKSLPTASKNVMLIDPPFSVKQFKDCHYFLPEGIELITWESKKQLWTEIRKEITRVLKLGGKCITCAWNSQGTGKGLGFDKTRLLILSHGGNRNDTIITVDVKNREVELEGKEKEEAAT